MKKHLSTSALHLPLLSFGLAYKHTIKQIRSLLFYHDVGMAKTTTRRRCCNGSDLRSWHLQRSMMTHWYHHERLTSLISYKHWTLRSWRRIHWPGESRRFLLYLTDPSQFWTDFNIYIQTSRSDYCQLKWWTPGKTTTQQYWSFIQIVRRNPKWNSIPLEDAVVNLVYDRVSLFSTFNNDAYKSSWVL